MLWTGLYWVYHELTDVVNVAVLSLQWTDVVNVAVRSLPWTDVVNVTVLSLPWTDVNVDVPHSYFELYVLNLYITNTLVSVYIVF